MIFRTAYNRPETIPAETGDGTEAIFKFEVNEDGEKVLVEQPEREDIYEGIQEALDGTLIENIVRRSQMGDDTVLNKLIGNFYDATIMPGNLAEAQNMILQAEQNFDLLPLDLRRKFDFSVEKFISMIGTSEFLDIISVNPVSDLNNNVGGDENVE